VLPPHAAPLVALAGTPDTPLVYRIEEELARGSRIGDGLVADCRLDLRYDAAALRELRFSVLKQPLQVDLPFSFLSVLKQPLQVDLRPAFFPLLRAQTASTGRPAFFPLLSVLKQPLQVDLPSCPFSPCSGSLYRYTCLLLSSPCSSSLHR